MIALDLHYEGRGWYLADLPDGRTVCAFAPDLALVGGVIGYAGRQHAAVDVDPVLEARVEDALAQKRRDELDRDPRRRPPRRPGTRRICDMPAVGGRS